MKKAAAVLITALLVLFVFVSCGNDPFFHKVTFDTVGGSEVASQIVRDGEKAEKPDDPTKEGYIFVRWSTEKDGETEFDFSTGISGDMTLYAVWKVDDGSGSDTPTPTPTPTPVATPTPTPTPVPTASPTPVPASRTYGPSAADLAGDKYADIELPADSAWLPDYTTIRYAQAPKGVAIYWYKRPVKGTEESGKILDGEQVTVLAVQSTSDYTYCLVRTSDGTIGWVTDGALSETRLLDSVPDLETSSYWIYKSNDGRTEAYVEFRNGNCNLCYIKSTDPGQEAFQTFGYGLSRRRLHINDQYFVWDGTKFVSSEGKLEFDPYNRYASAKT